MPFVTSDDPGRAHETCWILDVRSLTNPLDTVILSPKTKGSVINQAEWNWSEDSANLSQDRTGQIGFERYRIFVLLSRVRMLIPCLNWNKILLPGQVPLSHE